MRRRWEGLFILAGFLACAGASVAADGPWWSSQAALPGSPTFVINAANPQRFFGVGGTGTFVAGDDLDVRVDMAGTFAPTTSEAAVYIVVEWTS